MFNTFKKLLIILLAITSAATVHATASKTPPARNLRNSMNFAVFLYVKSDFTEAKVVEIFEGQRELVSIINELDCPSRNTNTASVDAIRTKLLQQVEPFLKDIFKNKGIIKKMVKKSLLKPERKEIGKRSFVNSFLEQSTPAAGKALLEKQLTTLADIRQACLEVFIFSNDLLNTFPKSRKLAAKLNAEHPLHIEIAPTT